MNLAQRTGSNLTQLKEDKKVRRFRKLKDRLRYKLEMKIFYLFLEKYIHK